MKRQPDFFKIFDSEDRSRLLAVVNLNYMFPIPKKMCLILKNLKLILTELLRMRNKKVNILICLIEN